MLDVGGDILEQSLSKCGAWNTIINLNWEFVDMQIIRPHLRSIKLQNAWVWFNQSFRWFWCKLNFGNYCFRKINLVTVHSMLWEGKTGYCSNNADVKIMVQLVAERRERFSKRDSIKIIRTWGLGLVAFKARIKNSEMNLHLVQPNI